MKVIFPSGIVVEGSAKECAGLIKAQKSSSLRSIAQKKAWAKRKKKALEA
jgi:hypothetical protein